MEFQSLFYWKFYFNSVYAGKKDIENMFQSLFYWKFYFNIIRGLYYGYKKTVSILILLEVLLQQLKEMLNGIDLNEFQSLFYWKFYFNCFRVRTQI